jgi:hypothetical protein
MIYGLYTMRRRSDGVVEQTYLREIDVSEFDRINNAIFFCRQYGDRLPIKIIFTTHESILRCVHTLPNVDGIDSRRLTDEIHAQLSAFCLFWTLFIDHAKSDLSRRFGKESAAYAAFLDACSSAYDAYPGYRLIDGLRNYVQHVRMPNVSVTVNRYLKPPDYAEEVLQVQLSLEVGNLLEALRVRGEKKLLQADLLKIQSGEVDLLGYLQSAMRGFRDLVATVGNIDGHELKQNATILKAILEEVGGEFPVIQGVSPQEMTRGSQSLSLKQLRFSDVIPLVMAVGDSPTQA